MTLVGNARVGFRSHHHADPHISPPGSVRETEENLQEGVAIYGNHIYFAMSTMKTTVYLDAADYRRLKALATADGRSAAELIRTAVSEYARRWAPGGLPRSLGAARSGDRRLSERAEDLLKGMGDES